ncbi:MAG: hypothetical protein NWE93_05485 [Candidatus Bathyarchaeota archaeon]|nr:hypothetical protein [Candidatus Bathyarchaeota archaeon]
MNLTEIVELLREIVDGSPGLEGNDFLIAPSKVAGSPIEGYGIHLTGNFNDETRRHLNDIALTRQLSIRQEPKSVMIYKAKKIENASSK